MFASCRPLVSLDSVRWLIVALLVGAPTFVRAAPPYSPPEGIDYRRVDIMSEGTRMQGEVFSLASLREQKLPTIIMSHGWGGNAGLLRPDAVFFAKQGYLVVTFDYRGWGESDSRVILSKPAPEHEGQVFTAEVREIREVVDPLDQVNDLLNAIHWVQAEPQCDTDRIGLWGSSYSGGHVVYAAARDPRVKALVSQVPALDSRFVIATDEEKSKTYDEATQRARGAIGYPEPGARVIGNLRGAPIREKLMHYFPVEDAHRSQGCAMLFLIAENEELFNNEEHAIKAHDAATGPKKLVVIPKIRHYGIYLQARSQAQKLALEWFNEHLKGGSAPISKPGASQGDRE